MSLYKKLWFQAGLKDSQLSLALEPEAASLYCRKIPVEINTQKDGAKQIASLPEGAKYLVLDLGGLFHYCIYKPYCLI